MPLSVIYIFTFVLCTCLFIFVNFSSVFSHSIPSIIKLRLIVWSILFYKFIYLLILSLFILFFFFFSVALLDRIRYLVELFTISAVEVSLF